MKVKIHHCAQCGRSFAYKANLQRHLKQTKHNPYDIDIFINFSIESTSEKYNQRFKELKEKNVYMGNLNESLVIQIESLKEENKKLDLKDRIIKQQIKQKRQK